MVTLTPQSGDVTFIVKGTNLRNRTNKNMIKYTKNTLAPMGEKYNWQVNTDGTEACETIWLRDFNDLTDWFEITYTNDSVSYTGSGLYIIYPK